jgi:hypothetical protein
LLTLKCHANPVQRVAFSESGQSLAWTDGTDIRIVDVGATPNPPGALAVTVEDRPDMPEPVLVILHDQDGKEKVRGMVQPKQRVRFDVAPGRYELSYFLGRRQSQTVVVFPGSEKDVILSPPK